MNKNVENINNLLNFLYEISKLTQAKQPIDINEKDLSLKIFLSEVSNFDNSNILFSKDESNIIFTIRYPKEKKVPTPPQLISEYIDGNYQDVNSTKITIHERVMNTTNKDEILAAYDEWKYAYDKWHESEIEAYKVRNLFERLRTISNYYSSNKDTTELLLGSLFVHGQAKASEYSSIQHIINYPLILNKISIQMLDQLTIMVSLIDGLPTIYDNLFSKLDNLKNYNQLLSLEDVDTFQNFDIFNLSQYKETIENIGNKFCLNNIYVENYKDVEKEDYGLVFENKHVIFVRNQILGLTRQIEECKQLIKETGEYPAFLDTLIEPQKIVRYNDDVTRREKILQLGGEVSDFYFTDKINDEQLKIVKAIEHYDAVLVQGPPGTGKTHTIANLVAHLMAQGKSILVTSQKSKALDVLLHKINDALQPLCVAKTIESKFNDQVTKTVQTINSILGLREEKLNEEITQLEKEIDALSENIYKKREELISLTMKEWGDVIINDKSYSIIDLSKKVAEDKTTYESILPALNNDLYENKRIDTLRFPLSNDELVALYNSNKHFDDECNRVLCKDLLPIGALISLDEFRSYCEKESVLLNDQNEFLNKYNLTIDDEGLIKTNNDNSLYARLNERKLNEQEFKYTLNLLNDFSFVIDHCPNFFELIYDSENITRLNNIVRELNLANEYYSKIENEYPKFIKLSSSFGNDYIKKTIKDKVSSKFQLSFLRSSDLKNFEAMLKELDLDYKDNLKLKVCNSYVYLIEQRERIELLWNNSFIKDIFGSYISLDNLTPEKRANDIIKHFVAMTNWKDKYKDDVIKVCQSIGVTSIDIYLSRDEDKVNTIIKDFIIPVLKFKEKYTSVLNDKTATEHSKYVLRQYLDKGNIYRNLYDALCSLNYNMYSVNYYRLCSIYDKKDLFAIRQVLLNKVKEYSIDWYNALVDKIDIHGDDVVPDKIYNAFYWRVANGFLDYLAKFNVEKEFDATKANSKKFKEKTKELAIKKSYLNVLHRFHDNPTASTALSKWNMYCKKIGKGTGKNAPKYSREAQRQMELCQNAVPVWIMSYQDVVNTMSVRNNKFDVVIVDEASQLDYTAIPLSFFGKKMIVVGDDEQVSPSNMFLESKDIEEIANKYLKQMNFDIPVDRDISLYDWFKAASIENICLKEHFRCVPSIIKFSNDLSYNGTILPLRSKSDSTLYPPVIKYDVKGYKDNDINEIEANRIICLILSCLSKDAYKNKSIGIISLLSSESQVKLLNDLVYKYIPKTQIDAHSILVGTPSTFQGDERDVIFVSVVDTVDKHRTMTREANNGLFKKRYNVAISRAKDQIWIVNSIGDYTQLKNEDLTRELLMFAEKYKDNEKELEKVKVMSDSIFEEEVATYLINNHYHIQQQYPVGTWRIDIVVFCNGKSIAIECDGDAYHSGDQVIKDMHRQLLMERIGWTFIRIRGHQYFHNKEKTLVGLIEQLNDYGVYPENVPSVNEDDNTLLNKIKNGADKYFEDIIMNRALDVKSTVKEEILTDKVFRKIHNESDILDKQKSEPVRNNANTTSFSANDYRNYSFKEDSKQARQKSVVNGTRSDTKNSTINTYSLNTNSLINWLKQNDIAYVDNIQKSKRIYIINEATKKVRIIKYLNDNKFKFSYDARGTLATNNMPCWKVELK